MEWLWHILTPIVVLYQIYQSEDGRIAGRNVLVKVLWIYATLLLSSSYILRVCRLHTQKVKRTLE